MSICHIFVFVCVIVHVTVDSTMLYHIWYSYLPSVSLQADHLSLFRGQGGRLGFTIERDGFVSDVLDYAAINGLQPGCRIVQVCTSVSV